MDWYSCGDGCPDLHWNTSQEEEKPRERHRHTKKTHRLKLFHARIACLCKVRTGPTDTPKTHKLQPLSRSVALLRSTQRPFPYTHNRSEPRKFTTFANSEGLCLIKTHRAWYKYDMVYIVNFLLVRQKKAVCKGHGSCLSFKLSLIYLYYPLTTEQHFQVRKSPKIQLSPLHTED